MIGCGNPECLLSSGVGEELTFGSGKLDLYGYWEHPCRKCAAAHDEEMIVIRPKLVEEFIQNYMEYGYTREQAAELVDRNHRYLFLAAWPFAEERKVEFT